MPTREPPSWIQLIPISRLDYSFCVKAKHLAATTFPRRYQQMCIRSPTELKAHRHLRGRVLAQFSNLDLVLHTDHHPVQLLQTAGANGPVISTPRSHPIRMSNVNHSEGRRLLYPASPVPVRRCGLMENLTVPARHQSGEGLHLGHLHNMALRHCQALLNSLHHQPRMAQPEYQTPAIPPRPLVWGLEMALRMVLHNLIL